MSDDELDSMAQDAKDYLQSLHDLGNTEKELVEEYQQGNYSDFADNQADIFGYNNDMAREATDMMIDINGTSSMKSPNGSDYDLAEYILKFCKNHKH